MILIPIVSLLGLIGGILVAHIAREELHDTHKYIRTLRYFLTLTTLITLVSTLPFPKPYWQIIYALILLTICVIEIRTKWPYHLPIISPLLLFTSLFFLPQELVLIPSSLFLLLGFPLGTEAYDAFQES